MSNEELRQQLKGIQSAYDSEYDVVESVAQEGLSSLKSKIGKMDIQFESKKPTPTERPQAKFTHLDIADRATATYKEKINPGVYKADDVEQPITHSTRTSMRAMASSLAGMRSSGNAGKMTQSTPNGNGDLGQYTSPANNNDGDLGNNTGYGQYYSLTTNMSMEEYQEHINSKFTKEVEASPLVETICSTCGCSPCECEVDEPLAQLKESLLQLEDSAWQSIDLVMREEANELGVTPKELHKFFKQETGLIPDDWLKENREVQLFGFMPLDEATAINKVGQVYDVTCMWRGNTMRLKFFWPQLGLCSKDECQNACEMFYPGSRLIAHYPCKDEPDNYMVIVPPIKESCEFVPEDTWVQLDEVDDAFYNYICEEVGEPLTPLVYHEDDDSFHMVVENHDTGEEDLIIAEAGGLHAWFSKSKSKDGKPGWVQSDGSTCARKPGQTSAPKCYSSQRLASLKSSAKGKKLIKSADARKKSQDSGQSSKTGAAKPTMVKTFTDPKNKKKYKSGDQTLKDESYDPTIDEACWAGYTQKGTKEMCGKQYPNCVKKGKTKKEEVEYVAEGGIKSGHKRKTEDGAGLTQKGVDAENAKTGGNLQTAVTTPPSKLKAGSKAAGRRKSFCARSRGWNGERGKAARRRWNC